MKTKSVILGLFVALTTLFTACSNDDGKKETEFSREKAEQILKQKYGTDLIEWRRDGKYDVAKLYVAANRSVEMDTIEVWYEGAFVRLTNEEIDFRNLPQFVQFEFQKTKDIDGGLYSDITQWEREDVYELDREGVVVYKIEVESVTGDEERALYFNEKGILIKDVLDEDERPLEVPAEINEWVAKNYKNAVIVDYEEEEEDGVLEYELDLLSGEATIELTLDKDLKIIEEEYKYKRIQDIEDSKVKDAIIEKINNNKLGIAINHLDEIKMKVKEDGTREYEVQFKKDDVEYELIIKVLNDQLEIGDIVED